MLAHTHTKGMSGSTVPAVCCRQRGVWVKYEPMCPLDTPMRVHAHKHTHLCEWVSEPSGSVGADDDTVDMA